MVVTVIPEGIDAEQPDVDGTILRESLRVNPLPTTTTDVAVEVFIDVGPNENVVWMGASMQFETQL